MSVIDLIKNIIGNGPKQKGDGDVVIKAPKPTTPGPVFEPPFVEQTTVKTFSELWQGRAFGKHARSLDVSLPGLIARGGWDVSIRSGGESIFRGKGATERALPWRTCRRAIIEWS